MNLYANAELELLLNQVESEQSERKSEFRTKEVRKKVRETVWPDMSPIKGATLSDLSRIIFEYDYLEQAFASDVLAANNRSYEERLASCKLIISPTDTRPTVVGMLTLGKDPLNFLPGAYIQFLRIAGTRLADPVIDEAMISGPLGTMLNQAKVIIKSHNRTAVDVTSSDTHRFEPVYPVAAIQQILYNAVMHREYEISNAPIRLYWYDDHIEIISPGGPYGSVTVENFGQPGITSYRNPEIASVLKVTGYIQQFGRGIQMARDAMRKNGNPDPEFEVNNSIITCIMRKKL